MFDNRSSFFIVGAPRCGTTAMSKILARHPEICFAKPKETHLFVQDLGRTDRDFWRQEFVEPFFSHMADEHTTLGEGSVSSLYSKDAVDRILDFDPEAKFIIMVRNPADLVYSYHGRMLFLLDEDEPDFTRAWRLQDERAAGRSLPKRCRDPRLLFYRDVARLAPHVERMFDTVGRERCFVVVFDDFTGDPAAVYRSLCEFLELPFDGRTEFKQKNAHRTYKNPFLQQFLVNPPPMLMKALKAANVTPKELRNRTRPLRHWIRRNNTAPEKRQPLTAEMRAELTAHFADDVARLGRLLDRDFSHWR